MKLQSIIRVLEEMAPPSLQEAYDNSGLQTGSISQKIKSALICIDVTENVVDEAVSLNCNLIISHHPLIFNGLKSITGRNWVERTLIKAIRKKMAIYALHTNLDNIPTGVNKTICDKLGLQNCKMLRPMRGNLKKLYTFCPETHVEEVRFALFECGCGRIGEYNCCSFNTRGYGTFMPSEDAKPFSGMKGQLNNEDEIRIECVFPAHIEQQIVSVLNKVHPYDEVAYDIITLDNDNYSAGAGMIGNVPKLCTEKEMLKKLKIAFGAQCVRHTKLRGKKIKKIAVCGGSGSFLLADAIAAGADLFVSSDFKYHQFFDADNNVLIADIGHYESEQFARDIIADQLKENFPNFALHLSKVNTNPVNYL